MFCDVKLCYTVIKSVTIQKWLTGQSYRWLYFDCKAIEKKETKL